MASSLMTAALSSRIECNVTLEAKPTESSPTLKAVLRVIFFDLEHKDNFALDLYQFYSIDKNRSIYDKAKELMKHPEKFEEIKAWKKENR